MIGSDPRWKLGWAAPSPDDLKLDEWIRLLDVLAESGYGGVQTMIGEPYHMESLRFTTLLSQRGLCLIGVRTGDILAHHGLRLSDPDPDRHRQAVSALCEVIDYAACFGKPKILVGMMQGKLQAGESITGALELIAEGLATAAKTAARHNMMIGLEPVNRYIVGYNRTIKDVKTLIKRIGAPNIQLLVDTFHMNIEEPSIAGGLMQASGIIGDVHLADNNRYPPGMGHFDFAEFFGALEQTEYQGFLTVECDPVPDSINAARQAAKHLQNWLG